MPSEEEVVEFLAKRWFDSTPGKKPGDGGRPTWTAQPEHIRDSFRLKAREFLRQPYELERKVETARLWARQARQMLGNITGD